ncbi:hypothetical protein CVT26_013097 [Gymnopilus dilepis]|uniref:Uncharacterized protein n=1 Tax=Gymnopilus dilepis TaxID=231916 RepID=A0A409YFH6_9AGAR|nr:hypothetical protein CVT26_013097 [Gymnopilus dilepis]
MSQPADLDLITQSFQATNNRYANLEVDSDISDLEFEGDSDQRAHSPTPSDVEPMAVDEHDITGNGSGSIEVAQPDAQDTTTSKQPVDDEIGWVTATGMILSETVYPDMLTPEGGHKRSRAFSPTIPGNAAKRALLSQATTKKSKFPTFQKVTSQPLPSVPTPDPSKGMVSPAPPADQTTAVTLPESGDAGRAVAPVTDSEEQTTTKAPPSDTTTPSDAAPPSDATTPSNATPPTSGAPPVTATPPVKETPTPGPAVPGPTENASPANLSHLGTLVPAPAGGWPKIHGITSQTLLQHVDEATRTRWNALIKAGPTLFVHVADYTQEEDCSPTMKKIKGVVALAILKTGFKLSAPTKDMTVRTPESPILPFLVYDLSRTDVDRLLSQPLWSTRDFTIFTATSDPFTTDHVLTFGNTCLEPTEEDEALMTEAVREVLRNDTWFSSFIQCFHDKYHAHYSPDDIFDDIIEKTKARALEINLNSKDKVTVFNIYIPSPTRDLAAFNSWVDHLRFCTYATDQSKVKIRAPFSCSHCKGTDHPSGLCPFFGILWTSPTDTSARRGRGRGRGRIGNFAGRNGGGRNRHGRN